MIMSRCHAFLLSLLAYKVQSVCLHPPVDLNTATVSEMDALPYISSSAAQSIIHIRPICSPQELLSSPKEIGGITQERLNTKWNWYEDKSCADTCCLADASCDGTHSAFSSDATYAFTTTPWSDCSASCNTGTQYRTVRCVDVTATDSKPVPNGICALTEPEPINKRLCNTHKCSMYAWIANEWSACEFQNDECIQTRTLDCYDTTYHRLETPTKCNRQSKVDTTQSCEIAQCAPARVHRNKPRLSPRIASTSDTVDDITVERVDLLNGLGGYNRGTCNTKAYYNVDDSILITRRSCAVDIEVYLSTDVANIDKSWFYLDAATVDVDEEQNVGDVFTDEYLSYSLTDATTARLTVTFPNDAYIGKFVCTLYFQRNGEIQARTEVASFTLYVLFNPYSSADDVYITSRLERSEYIENTEGLIWYGSVTQNTARSWDYDQYNVKNLDVSMHLLRRLPLEYRNDTVLISRQISYAVADDICYGKWSEPYTTGKPSYGYRCSEKTKNCYAPWEWTGTTAMFDLYRDVLNYKYRVQYCQCWVFAGVTTTVGRSLGIGTRPVTNFQSAHDTDFNRAIEKFWYWNSWSKTFSETSGDSGDSVWNFHVWNDMYFKRHDFADESHNVNGWQAVDATPQEVSYGGNPALSGDDDDVHYGAYQMGPASLAMIKQNSNPSDCKWAAPHRARFGCFDQEFVISEVNAYYNLWYKTSRMGSEYTLYDSFTANPFNGKSHTAIGQQMSTKMPGFTVSDDCSNEAIRDCTDDLFDITLQYKDAEPSGADEPTNTSNHYVGGDTRGGRDRRRLLGAAGSATVGDIDFNALDYTVDLIPNEWYVSSMIIADEKEDIVKLYGGDFTFGQMSVNIDSFYDTAMYMYCSFTVTAHDYRGDQIRNESVKVDKTQLVLQAGMHTSCAFHLNYSEYRAWVDVEEVPYSFKFAISVSLFKSEADAMQPFGSGVIDFEPIVEERDVIICSPRYKLSDRIVCKNGLKWDEPSHNLTYDCNAADGIHIESVGDGFCDDINNKAECYDGGDCCPTSCIPSDAHFCENFDCKDDRVLFQNKHYYECPKALSFIDYINALFADSICVSLAESIIGPNLVCSPQIWEGNTENACFDHVNAARDVYGDVKTCLTQTLNSMESEMAEIIEWAIDCWHDTHNETVTTLYPQSSSVTAKTGDDATTKKNITPIIVVVILAVVFVLALSGIAHYFYTKNKRSEDEINQPFVQTDQDHL